MSSPSSPPPPKPSFSIVLAGVASAGFHVALAVGWGFYPAIGVLFPPSPPVARAAEQPPAPAAQPRDDDAVDVDYPTISAGAIAQADTPPATTGTPPIPMGGSTVARMETGEGRGGDVTAAEQATNLSDGDEHMTLTLDPMNRFDRSQVQRLRSSDARRSWEDRRSTTHPSEDSFVQNGDGTVMEKRDPSRADPSRGAAMGFRASTPGSFREGSVNAGDDGPAPDDGHEIDPRPLATLGGEHAGAPEASPGAGLAAAAAGQDHRSSADVARARPDVTQAPIAVQANERDRPSDDEFSYQEIQQRVQAYVHASTAGGAQGDDGRGGSGGGGDPGAGADTGAGSASRPLGASDGSTFELYSSDPRLAPYFRILQSKIRPYQENAFPKSALLELKQGTVILSFVVHADGSATVAWPPIKPSGIDEFDRNCANAIRRAAPFPPIPTSFGRSSLTIVAPFVAKNPIIK